MSKVLNMCSVSGGKDSTVLYCAMVEAHGHDFLPIFANTGHEHPVTLNYVKNLHIMAGGPPVVMVEADFRSRIIKKRGNVLLKAKEQETIGDVRDLYQRSLKIKPSGNAFLDLMIWKGRAPSTKAQFCTEHLKLWPILFYIRKHFPDHRIVTHSGIRAGESQRRSRMQPFSWNDFFDCEQVLPLLYETEEFIFAYLEEKGVPPNPLYGMGFSRVGCFPCIHAIKEDLFKLPDWVWDKLEYWENWIGRSWFPAGVLPSSGSYIPKIADVRDWCRTSRGGKQFDMFRTQPEDAPSCMTGWINCE